MFSHSSAVSTSLHISPVQQRSDLRGCLQSEEQSSQVHEPYGSKWRPVLGSKRMPCDCIAICVSWEHWKLWRLKNSKNIGDMRRYHDIVSRSGGVSFSLDRWGIWWGKFLHLQWSESQCFCALLLSSLPWLLSRTLWCFATRSHVWYFVLVDCSGALQDSGLPSTQSLRLHLEEMSNVVHVGYVILIYIYINI